MMGFNRTDQEFCPTPKIKTGGGKVFAFLALCASAGIVPAFAFWLLEGNLAFTLASVCLCLSFALFSVALSEWQAVP